MNEDLNELNIELKEWLFEYKHAKDQKTKEKLKSVIVVACMPLVTKVAKSFARRSSDPVEDIAQVGAIGLLKAVDLYVDFKNTNFKTYATYLITGEIRHYLRDKVPMIRAPREIKELSYRLHKITAELTEKYSRTPTDAELAEALNLPEARLEELIDLDRRTTTISIDQTQSDGGDGVSTIADKIPDESEKISEEIIEKRIMVEEAINSLPEDDKEIIKLNFYLGLSQKEISEKLNMSQMQVSRKMKKALGKLLKFVTRKGMVSYE